MIHKSEQHAMPIQLHATDSHLCGLRIWLEPIGLSGHRVADSVRQAQEVFARMADYYSMPAIGLRTSRTAEYQDRLAACEERMAALEQDLARANRERSAWQERAEKAEAENQKRMERLMRIEAALE